MSKHGLETPQLTHPACVIYCPNCGLISGYSLPNYVDQPGWEEKWKKDKSVNIVVIPCGLFPMMRII